MTAKPYILLTAGHRSTQDPGDPIERALTDDLAQAYLDVFVDAGFTTDWWQQSLNANDNPTMTVGDLTTVALGVAEVLGDRPEALSILLDLHFNGRSSAVHSIVPDVGDLRTNFTAGAPAIDTAENNSLDLKLASAIATGIVAANPGMHSFWGKLGVKGVMSEQETGVALDGRWRLAMFAATARHRMKAVRLVIEHGGTNDADEPEFFRRCAKAALKAVQDRVPGAGGAAPDDGGETPPVIFADPIPRPWAERLRRGESVVETVDGQDWFAVNRLYQARQVDERRQTTLEGSLVVGPPVDAGTISMMTAIGRGSNGKVHLLSAWNTVFDAPDWTLVPWPEHD